MKTVKNSIWGILFIIVGVIWGLNALDITRVDITLIDGWWTFFIIIPCLIGFLTEKDKKGNLIGLCIGVALFLCCRGFLGFGLLWKLLIPAIFVMIGLSYLGNEFFPSRCNTEIKRLNGISGQRQEYCSTFSGQNIDYSGEIFQGANLTSVFGGLKCDVRQAIIEDNQVINCSAIFGGIEIYVPTDVRVKVKSNAIFGGVSEKNSYVQDVNAPVIYINASCIFGGVKVI